jgi:peptide/nickel transport system substrate-binding protein
MWLALAVILAPAYGQYGGELRFCLQGEPKTFNPLLVEDDPSEVVRYLTGGVLIRINRSTQEVQPELAASWKIDENGKRIAFQIRSGLRFSDGTPFTAEDVAETMRMVMDPKLHAPVGDAIRSSGGGARITVAGPDKVAIAFPSVVSGMERLFDQVAILSSKSPKKEAAALGPFYVADYQPGSEVLLKKNPHYWKRDPQGRALPYLDAIRLSIQQNRSMEMVRFARGELHLINSVAPDNFDWPRMRHRLSVTLGLGSNRSCSGSTSRRRRRCLSSRRRGSAPRPSGARFCGRSTATIFAASSIMDTPARRWDRFRRRTAIGTTTA